MVNDNNQETRVKRVSWTPKMDNLLLMFLFANVPIGSVSKMCNIYDISLINHTFQYLTSDQARRVAGLLNITCLQLKNHVTALKNQWRKASQLANYHGDPLDTGADLTGMKETICPNFAKLNEFFSTRNDFPLTARDDDQSRSFTDSSGTSQEGLPATSTTTTRSYDSVTVPPIRPVTTTPRVPALIRPVVTEDRDWNRVAAEDDFQDLSAPMVLIDPGAPLRKRTAPAPTVSHETKRPMFRPQQLVLRPKLPVSVPMVLSKRDEMILAAKFKKEELVLATKFKREEITLAAELKREEIMLTAELKREEMMLAAQLKREEKE